MKINYQTPIVRLLFIKDGYALCQTSGGDTIGKGEDFIWEQTSLSELEQ